MRERLLSVVMLLMGVLLIIGSTASTFATSIFPFDKYLGINASVAGVVRQVVAEVLVQWPVSLGNCVLPSESPWATYSELYSFS